MVAMSGGFGLGEIPLSQAIVVWIRLFDTVGGYGSAVPAGITGAAYPGQE